MPKATFKIVLRDDKETSSKGKQLFLRITYNRKSTYKYIGVKVEPKHWDKKKGVVKKSYANSVRLNNLLSKTISEYEDSYLRLVDAGNRISLDAIKNGVANSEEVDFFTFFEKHLKLRLDEDKYGTHDKELVIYNKLKKFTKNDNFKISEIDYHFLESFRDHLREEYQNSINTIHGNLRVIRMLLNKAERQDLIKYENNPFRKFKMKKEDSQRVYLTEEEVRKIREVELNPEHRIYHHRQMFLFACYACGLRVSDLLTLKWSSITDTHVEIKMKKTKSVLKFKLMDKALEILNEYRNNDSIYVFPFLPDDAVENLKFLDSQLSSCTAYYNKDLKKIAKKAGIDKNLSSHIARHTFATIALRQRVPIEYVSKLLGHRDIKTTQIYVKIINAELDKAVDQIKF